MDSAPCARLLDDDEEFLLGTAKAATHESRSCTCRDTCATCWYAQRRTVVATSMHLSELRSPSDGGKLLTSDRIQRRGEVERERAEKLFCGRKNVRTTRSLFRYKPYKDTRLVVCSRPCNTHTHKHMCIKSATTNERSMENGM